MDVQLTEIGTSEKRIISHEGSLWVKYRTGKGNGEYKRVRCRAGQAHMA
jgi:hypothetical protein